MALLVGVLCVCTFFALLFGLWGYSGLGWRAFVPFGVFLGIAMMLIMLGLLLLLVRPHPVRLWG